MGTTVAGIWSSSGISSSQFKAPFRVVLDSLNTLYITDYVNRRVQNWLPNESSGTTVAGNANATTSAALNHLYLSCGLAIDSVSNLYIVDAGNHRIQFWAKDGSTDTMVAGTDAASTATNQLNLPSDITLDETTSTFYIADSNNDRIMKYSLGSTAGTIFAEGNGRVSSNTQLNYPVGIYSDLLSNSLYITNYQEHTVVRWVIGASSWTVVFGSSSDLDGSTPTLLKNPIVVTLDTMRNVYIVDAGNQRIQLFIVGQFIDKPIVGVTTTTGIFSTLLQDPH